MKSKVCTDCGKLKKIINYHKDSANSDGHKNVCKDCRRPLIRKWSKENVIYDPIKSKQYYEANKDKYHQSSSKYYNKNKKKCLDAQKKWQSKNKGLLNYHGATTHLKKHKTRSGCIPKWLTKKHKNDMINIYQKASDIQAKTGIKMHVDHIIPIHGINICGLHVPENLQIIPRYENLKKSNKY